MMGVGLRHEHGRAIMSANEHIGASRAEKRFMEGETVMGRPLKLYANEETLETLAALGQIQCTTKEVAAVLRVRETTLMNFFNDVPEAREIYEDAKEGGKMSLRRRQWTLAETNAAMAIFLGKNILGQADKSEVEHSGGLDVTYAQQRVRDKIAAIVAAGETAGNPNGD